MWHVHARDWTESIEGATGCRYTAHVRYLISVYGIYGRGWITVPCIGLVKVERLGQWLNVPTQGRRVAQTGTKPSSLMMPGSDPQPGIEPGMHWWEVDTLAGSCLNEIVILRSEEIVYE